MKKRRVRKEPIVLSQMRPFTLFLVLCGCILFTFSLIHFDSFAGFLKRLVSALGPVIAGMVIAYLLNPAEKWLEKRISRPINALMAKRYPEGAKLAARGISSFLVVLLFLGFLVLLVAVTFSQVLTGLETFLERLPSYIDMITTRAERIVSENSRILDYLKQFNDNILSSQINVDPTQTAQTLLSAVLSGAAGTLGILYDVVVGFIIAVYLLISKERFIKQWKQVLFAVCKPKTAKWINSKARAANKTFGTAIVGKIADSTIIGLICFIVLLILNMPYYTLIAVIIGVTNVIPFFGPIIGAIPCVLIVLMENPLKALYLLIVIVVLQQFDCNYLDPKIVGSSIGLPAFWELFACLLGGGLFGIVGMVIGVPTFAVIYAVIKQLVQDSLLEKELDKDFLRDTLGIEPTAQQSGLFEDDDDDAERLVILEDIAPQITEEKTE